MDRNKGQGCYLLSSTASLPSFHVSWRRSRGNTSNQTRCHHKVAVLCAVHQRVDIEKKKKKKKDGRRQSGRDADKDQFAEHMASIARAATCLCLCSVCLHSSSWPETGGDIKGRIRIRAASRIKEYCSLSSVQNKLNESQLRLISLICRLQCRAMFEPFLVSTSTKPYGGSSFLRLVSYAL